MEHGHLNPNLETEPSGNYGFEGPQDEGGVDANIAGPSGINLQETSFRHRINYPNTGNSYWVPGVKIPESKEPLFIKLEINQNIEIAKLKNDNDYAETLELGNNNILETVIQDKESGKNHYICKFCSQVFEKHQALGGHMNGHSKDQRNLEKFGKVTSWIHATYPPPLHTTLASDAKLQGTPTNGVAFNSYNDLVEVGNVYSQLGKQWTNQQSTQQIQLSPELQIQQQLQYYQAQELQHYQYSQGLQSNQALERLQSPQALQSPQNYQTPQGLQNHQASQESQSYQTPQQFQNYQTPQEPSKYYQALQGSQNYQVPQRLQYYQARQRFQNYQTPQGPRRYQTPQGSQSYQALQGSQIYQTPQGQWQQLVANVNNQQNINLNSKTSNKPKSLSKAPSNEQKYNSSNSQGLHVQKEAQGPQRYMPNPYNLRNGDHLTTGPFINEKMNMKYYAKLGPNIMRSNQMISIAHDYNIVAQDRPTNSPNTSDSFIQSKDE